MTRMMTTSTRTTAARVAAPIGAAAALLTSLTGCAAADSATPIDASYRDGSYEASGSYESPNGRETIDVRLVLEGDIVTEVEVTTNPTNPTTANFQGRFADGIAAIVVGKDIDTLDVTVVAGSSLTGNGFREAVAAIKAAAVEG